MAELTEKSSVNRTDRYRVVVYDDDTLAELRTTKVTKSGILIGLILFFLTSSLLTALLISYTPLRYLVPGYADITNNRTYMEISSKITALEEELDAQRTYTNGLKNMLNPTGAKISDLSGLEKASGGKMDNDPTALNIPLDHYYFYSPLNGTVSSQFDQERKHFGIDIVAEKDSPIKCILDGVVINADWSAKTGNTISVQHDNDIISVYKHNSKLLKNIGEKVQAGEAIAIIGNTGLHSSGPHVHFELWQKGQPINPLKYIDLNK